MTLMRRNLFGRPALAALVGSVVSFAATGAVAQTDDGTIWLECDETASNGDLMMVYEVLAVRVDSIIGYSRENDNRLRRWGDFCREGEAQCRINEDEIFARFKPAAGEFIYRIDRRTGRFRFENTWGQWKEGQCRRIEDPRPPAAF
jgi:hypothetical protein